MGPLRVLVVGDYDLRDLDRTVPEATPWSGAVTFERDADDGAVHDGVLVLNRVPETLRVRADPRLVWRVIQEPYVPGGKTWVAVRPGWAARTFTHRPRRASDVRCPPLVPWHVGRTWDDLDALAPPAKTADVSMVISAKTQHPGHVVRRDFAEALARHLPVIDRFGRGVRPVDDKWDALAPYRYSVAIENTGSPTYWTEKLADCFLTWTVPFYAGAPDVADHFPEESFVRIDVDDLAGSVATIEATVSDADWRARLPALAEARRRVLTEHHLLRRIAAEYAEAAATRGSPRSASIVIDPIRPGRARRGFDVVADRLVRTVRSPRGRSAWHAT